ncbi:hypothetical protein D3C81_2214610 [compost metagenome]
MEGALRLMDVPPDDIQSWLAAQAAGKTGQPAAKPMAEPDPALLPDAADEVEAGIPTANAAALPLQEARQ